MSLFVGLYGFMGLFVGLYGFMGLFVDVRLSVGLSVVCFILLCSMNGLRVVTTEEVIDRVDIVITATGVTELDIDDGWPRDVLLAVALWRW